MTHAHKKGVPEDSDRNNPLHDKICSFLAHVAKQATETHIELVDWLDPPSRESECIFFYSTRSVEEPKANTRIKKWIGSCGECRWEIQEARDPQPYPNRGWTDWVESCRRYYGHKIYEVQGVCEQETHALVQDYRRGVPVPSLSINGYLDVWITCHRETAIAIEVKATPVPVADAIRQILYYRNSCLPSGFPLNRAYWILATAYPLEPSNLEKLQDRGIKHIEVSPSYVESWWAAKNISQAR